MDIREDLKSGTGTRFCREAAESAAVVARQEAILGPALRGLAARLRSNPPQVVVTCARGSSAHAATFFKHLVETRLGIPVCEAAPGITSVYGRALRLHGQFFLAVSQSGGSDDLIENARMAKQAGACTACLVNDLASPLAAACDVVLPMAAGPEIGVAATKTFVASVTGLLRLVAFWKDDTALAAALGELPRRLAKASPLGWSESLGQFREASNAIVLGRGPTLAIAREAALKLKEVTRLHAEAFSGAEFMHGPIALANRGSLVLLFVPSDTAGSGLLQRATALRALGANTLIAAPQDTRQGQALGLSTGRAETDAVYLIQRFYRTLPHIAAWRGADPDCPPHLEKVTRTF